MDMPSHTAPPRTVIISHSGLHEPWREILHRGTRLVLPRSPYNHQSTTDCFYLSTRGACGSPTRVRSGRIMWSCSSAPAAFSTKPAS
ncbi:MAG: hypothetical protein V8Q84_04565 [Bilophila sp.]